MTLRCIVRVAGLAVAVVVVLTLGGVLLNHYERETYIVARARVLSSTILLIGDSVAYQAGPPEICGRPVMNAAVSGTGVFTIQQSATKVASLDHPSLVILAIGINDWTLGNRDLGRWGRQYENLISSLHPARLALVQVYPVDQRKALFKKYGLPGVEYVQRENDEIAATAARHGAILVSAPQKFDTKDGIHPTDNGIKQWRDNLSASVCRVLTHR